MSPIRFEMLLDEDILERVERWRAEQHDIPSRAEAVRRLLDIGLSKARMSISDGEKLILMMLRDLYKHHKVTGDTDPEFVQNVLLGGHYWALEWKSPGLFHGHADSMNVVRETLDVLEMWYFIESGHSKLPEEQKERVKLEAEPFGDPVRFRGFDGNTEGDYGRVAKFLIEDLGRFEDFKGRNLNSHVPIMQAYRRMLVAFEPMLRTIAGRELSATEIIKLLKELGHPTSLSN